MKVISENDKNLVLKLLKSLESKIDDSFHWVGFNSPIQLNKKETIDFINKMVEKHKHLSLRYYPEENQVFLEISLSGSNQLNINLK